MPRFVALLRGVNVGGSRVAKMADVTAAFYNAGATNVATFIQSGNVVFAHEVRSAQTIVPMLEAALAKKLGFDVTLTLRTPRELAAVIAKNPYAKADAKTVHVYFAPTKLAADALAAIDASKFSPEECKANGREVYLHLPKGIGNSKLAAKLSRTPALVLATARRIEVVEKIFAMASA